EASRMKDRKVSPGPLARFLSAFTLMSRIPVRASFQADFSRADFWIPALGPFAGLASVLGFGIAIFLTGSLGIAAASALAAQYFLFNLFHFDGLVDSADALLPIASRERRLEILKDPRVGVYGFFSGLCLVAFKFFAISELAEAGIMFSALGAGLLGAPAAGRAAAALIASRLPPAREGGLGSLMRGFSLARILAGFAIGLLPAIAWAAFAGGWALSALALLSAAAGALVSAAIVGSAYRKDIGGFTGDALGAAIELGEVATLVFLCMALRFYPGALF
ncbi:MAG TPA: adenosylcobinamide-GDP ribazoletransferase, partial [Rectinemataceae bacterium]